MVGVYINSLQPKKKWDKLKIKEPKFLQCNSLPLPVAIPSVCVRLWHGLSQEIRVETGDRRMEHLFAWHAETSSQGAPPASYSV